ncbi:MAG: 5-methyltetrahydropteroyltriglutamate--homocysteine S-methyltransferase [Shewanella sp.]|jgi:5-methyltetrahydropteroyltriglutamate--homocysteine methyltransferase|uniref:5-methyltetrahydropteroyltriglutamate-- homocysteine S-methyltransferase n=1 Tax=unclassified Shewanella TaxID=196818 RepID=UPI0021D95A6D|nr:MULTISPECIES: 5-methyltetrahydropteroyltriglutamate--homocysteine S-methyltransferase [unclassified Shewanella]MCU8008852.1 5-methyltetrahydropteroyltriglutamate--homocysteine S-methyltransferase [Shewanella sp. SM87]MCU8033065.1 5-methyltetrahydropteroyltriglutamate--homocysteine S-methyltransferase [Shewanella sp. SM71]MCU8055011.1 5-methyltetrahydropteroyltriglutamate--homocysteine S-methyltransferase [Shewanella sp. SM35]MCU8063572.1 5-methyltetrahydropteroyltriglutamate--homocysteine S-
MQLNSLGFPRIGRRRELKFALEKYWRGESTQAQLREVASELRRTHWQWQAAAGIEQVPVGDFAFYDQVLTLSATLNAIPDRHRGEGAIDLDTLFRVARGRAPTGQDAPASEMTKYFNTNYHYLVPELSQNQEFSIAYEQFFDEVSEAQSLGYKAKPVLLGPVSYLFLAKTVGQEFDKLSLLPNLLAAYADILVRFAALGVQWVQLDEPILALELDGEWQAAMTEAYQALSTAKVKILLTSYYGGIAHHQALVSALPVAGLHVDLVTAPDQLAVFAHALGRDQILSVGVVNGRNVWAAEADLIAERIGAVARDLGDRLWIGTSCSLLHSPVDLDVEATLEPALRQQLAFAKQKLLELANVRQLLLAPESIAAKEIVQTSLARREAKAQAADSQVIARVAALTSADYERVSDFTVRQAVQQQKYRLPLLPTTTIGSFPQTPAIRGLRSRWRKGDLSDAQYTEQLQQVTRDTIDRQLKLGIDVLVHGEAERNDMVEYFGEQLAGVGFTKNGWVQSYGSRCVKPPLIYGDVSRPKAMTVDWAEFAQSLTDKPVKGMLTGPVTILHWSFAREDIGRDVIATQLALAIRDEVVDLQNAGIGIIQIDEPAFREGLPLKQSEWQAYLDWAVNAFKLSAAGVIDETQIHTHMCYSEFNDTIAAIAAMDADVITIETSRSRMELLNAFEDFEYPNEIGPGVYDIHSPNTPSVEAMVHLIEKAAQKVPVRQLWVNPDCGLKTRTWDEVEPALKNMVDATRELRRRLG